MKTATIYASIVKIASLKRACHSQPIGEIVLDFSMCWRAVVDINTLGLITLGQYKHDFLPLQRMGIFTTNS